MKPNFLIITLHDLGDFLPCYGRVSMPTPNIDRIVQNGAMLNHFSTSTVCSPARGAIMTGCYPHTHGLMGLVHRGWRLNTDACPTIPTLLASTGYQRHLFGFQHEHWDWHKLGYEQKHDAEGGHHAECVLPDLCAWLKSPEAREKPFFVSAGVAEVHRSGLSPSGWKRPCYRPADPASVQVPDFLPDIPEVRGELADLYGAIRHVDDHLGQVLDTLNSSGLAENTLLLFTTDHGISIIHAKATLYDGGIKVACLAQMPGVIPAGLRVQAPTSHVDILPTILELAGVKTPGHVQGSSLLSQLRGQTQQGREFIFAERNVTNYFCPSRAVRNDSFKYVRHGVQACVFDWLIPEVEQSRTDFRSVRGISDFYDHERVTEELFDLKSDPGELRNLIRSAAHASVLAQLRRTLDEHFEKTDDPFRKMVNPIALQADGYVELAKFRGK